MCCTAVWRYEDDAKAALAFGADNGGVGVVGDQQSSLPSGPVANASATRENGKATENHLKEKRRGGPENNHEHHSSCITSPTKCKSQLLTLTSFPAPQTGLSRTFSKGDARVSQGLAHVRHRRRKRMPQTSLRRPLALLTTCKLSASRSAVGLDVSELAGASVKLPSNGFQIQARKLCCSYM